MTAQHFAGALGLPIKPGTNPAPTLEALLCEFEFTIRRECADAWHTHYPGEPIIRKSFARDPEDGDFMSNDLPALFLWVANTLEAEQIADDYRVTTDNLTLMWIPHPAPDQKRQLSSQFWSDIDKAIRLVAGKRGSGMHNEATVWGGNTVTRLGLWDLAIGRGEPTEIRIATQNETTPFTVYQWGVTVRESIGTPITSSDQPVHAPSLNTIYTTGGEDPLTLYESQFPNP